MNRFKIFVLVALSLAIASCGADPLKETMRQETLAEGLVERTFCVAVADDSAAPTTNPADDPSTPTTNPANDSSTPGSNPAPTNYPANDSLTPCTNPANDSLTPGTNPANDSSTPGTNPADDSAAPTTNPANDSSTPGTNPAPGSNPANDSAAPTTNPAPTTKSFLSEGTPVWEVGEKVSVYDPVAGVPRIFNVDAVENGSATISGLISDGDFVFSAVYPASRVSSWNSIDEPVYAAPASQTITPGRFIAPDALVSRAFTAAPAEGITFRNVVSLVRFEMDRDDVEKVEFLLGDEDRKYTVRLSEGNFEKGKAYYMTVDAGEYSSIRAVCTTDFDISYTKSSSRGFNARANAQTNLSVVSDGTDRHINYTTFKSPGLPQTINGIDGFVNYLGLLDNEQVADIYNSSVVQASLKDLLKKYVPSYEKTAHILCFDSKSAGPGGRPQTVSTYIIYPEGAIKGIVLANHASTTLNSECPTRMLPYESAFCFKGYAVVMSDYYGLGSSSAYPQAYLDAEVTSRGNIDALAAARQVMKDMGIACGTEVVNLGYSQGAHSAMANVRYVSEHPECGVSFSKTFVGGGPFDVDITFDGFLSGAYPGAVPYTLVCICGLIENNGLDVDYADVFQEPLRSNYASWILSKNYSTSYIINRVGTSDITKILSPQIISRSGEAYDAIYETARRNTDLTKGWAAPSGSRIYIYHSREDDMIPYANKAAMVNSLKAGGCTPVVDLDLVEVRDNKLYTSLLSKERILYNLIEAAAGLKDAEITHTPGAAIFFADIVLNRW